MTEIRLGVVAMLTDESLAPGELARLVEQGGLHSLYVPEHTHLAAEGGTPYPGGGPLPRPYMRTLDPLVGLSMAAAATKRVTLGLGVCLLAQRDVLVTTKALSTLDLLSGGRLDVAVGAGWNLVEIANHGVAPSDRFDLLAEKVQVMSRLWSEDRVDHDGRFLSFKGITSDPKPTSLRGVLVGSEGPKGRELARSIGAGWLPMDRGDSSGLAHSIRDMASATVHRPNFRIVVYGARADLRACQAYVAAGATELLFWLPHGDRDQVTDRIQIIAQLGKDLR